MEIATQTKQYTLKVVQDENPISPREWDNLGTMAYKHRNYTLGDEEIPEPIEWLEDMLNLNRKREYSNERLTELEELFFEQYIALPLYLYDHSGITISTTPFSCRWDSEKVGYIYVSKEKIREEYGWKKVTDKRREKILSYLKGEVETFDQYIRGDVYGFQVEDEDGNHIDSCYGFYGDDFLTNGIKEHIDASLFGGEEKLVELLKEIEVTY